MQKTPVPCRRSARSGRFRHGAAAAAVAAVTTLIVGAVLGSPISAFSRQAPDDSLTALPLMAALPRAARGEVRAMWIVRDTLTSPQRIRNAVALARQNGFNTLFVQARGRGDAFYQSEIEPRAEELSGQPYDFDPLLLMTEEAHAAGIEVHAWMNTFYVWSRSRKPYSARHVVHTHPEWLVRDRQNRFTLSEQGECEGAFLDPALPAVRDYTKRVFLDVATRYPVDGIHFDYVRYPGKDYSFSEASLTAFRAWALPQLEEKQTRYADGKVAAGSRLAWFYCFPNLWNQWRQDNVTETVREIAAAARILRPGIVVSAAVFPDESLAATRRGQAWYEWLQNDLLDAACPMTYNRSTEIVAGQIRDAVENANGKPIIAGVGAWQISAASTIAKGRALRAVGAAGINLFSYNGITREGASSAYLNQVNAALFGTPTLAPDWRKPVVLSATVRREKKDGVPTGRG